MSFAPAFLCPLSNNPCHIANFLRCLVWKEVVVILEDLAKAMFHKEEAFE